MNLRKILVVVLIVMMTGGIYYFFIMEKSNIVLSKTIEEFVPVKGLPENIKFDEYASAIDMIVIPDEIMDTNTKIEASGGIYNNGNVTVQIAKYYDTSVLIQVVDIINEKLLNYNMNKEEININGANAVTYYGTDGTILIINYENYLIGLLSKNEDKNNLIRLGKMTINSIKGS